ncbi:BppU family phage baseplate upper protein [Bacillus thuringiensis]
MQYKDFATKEEELKVMRFYQNDLNSAKLLINVTHDKVVTDFSTATKVQIAFLKPDGKRVFQDVQNVNQMQGKYYVVLSTQTLIAYGNVVAQLRLTFANNKVIETCKFVFAVDESIMSDTALESTNEFPVIQKAIEVGEKFKDVDFAPIIKAGELAAGALPKAGGTMTGNLSLDRKASETRDITYRKDGVDQLFLGVNNSDKFRLWDNVNTLTAFEYAPLTKLFTMFSDLALPKGATVTGPLVISGTMSQLRVDDKGPSIRIDQPNDTKTTSARGLSLHENNVMMGGVGRIRNGTTVDQMYMGWGANPWSENTSLTVSDAKFLYKNKPVAMRDKDGRVTLTLTSDAVNFSANRPLIADRRGNTVTVRGAVGLNSTAVGNVISTLPTDVRPTTDIPMTMLATDGTFLAGDIMQDGRINFWTKGKNVYLSFTYVVD